MPKPRNTLVSLEETPYYHCVSRCVRRAFLCGVDKHSGTSFEHRRGWIRDRMITLAQQFAVDICAYAVMHNHYHIVFHIDRDRAERWEPAEVIRRWHKLFSGTALTHRYLKDEPMSRAELQAVDDRISQWRARLMDISWFMRCLNEAIARRANREDDCTGRFWEGRFKSQALLDEKALAACLAYVDLNPIRAGIANTAETSDFTSIQERITKAKKTEGSNPTHLLPFVGNPGLAMPKGLPFSLKDYLELVDWTGRAIRDDKRGAIPQNLPPILERLQISKKQWLQTSRHFESRFKGLVGAVEVLKATCHKLGYRRTPCLGACQALLS